MYKIRILGAILLTLLGIAIVVISHPILSAGFEAAKDMMTNGYSDLACQVVAISLCPILLGLTSILLALYVIIPGSGRE